MIFRIFLIFLVGSFGTCKFPVFPNLVFIDFFQAIIITDKWSVITAYRIDWPTTDGRCLRRLWNRCLNRPITAIRNDLIGKNSLSKNVPRRASLWPFGIETRTVSRFFSKRSIFNKKFLQKFSGHYPPIGYVRACLDDFVKYDRPGDLIERRITSARCELVPLRALMPSTTRRSRNIFDFDDRRVNACVCNSSYCNDASLRASGERPNFLTLISVIGIGVFQIALLRWRLEWWNF